MALAASANTEQLVAKAAAILMDSFTQEKLNLYLLCEGCGVPTGEGYPVQQARPALQKARRHTQTLEHLHGQHCLYELLITLSPSLQLVAGGRVCEDHDGHAEKSQSIRIAGRQGGSNNAAIGSVGSGLFGSCPACVCGGAAGGGL